MEYYKIICLNYCIGYYNYLALQEKDDCSVYTIATAFCIPYLIAHQYLENNGREFKKACKNWDFLMEELENEKLVKRLPMREYRRYYQYKKKYCYMTIDTFLKTHPSGKYIITTSGHVTTIRDGILYDRIDSKKFRVQYAHRILN